MYIDFEGTWYSANKLPRQHDLLSTANACAYTRVIGRVVPPGSMHFD